MDYDVITRMRDERYSGSPAHASSESDSDSSHSHLDASSADPHSAFNSSTDIPTDDEATSYITISFTPLARALGFEYDPPGDVIMRGWAGILGIGGGRGKGAARGAASSGLDGGDGRVSEPGMRTLAPGDATCVTVQRTSKHVFDYR
jgi:hypothetical protein